MRRMIQRFLKDESGLVTVEWVAIAAALVVGGISIAWAVLDNLDPAAAQIGTSILGVADDAPGAAPDFGDGVAGDPPAP